MLDLRIWTIDQSRSGSLSKLVVKLVTAECENLLLVQKFNCTLTWKIPGWSNRSWSVGRTWQQISCFPIFKKSTSADNVLQACVFVSWEEGTPFKGWKWSFIKTKLSYLVSGHSGISTRNGIFGHNSNLNSCLLFSNSTNNLAVWLKAAPFIALFQAITTKRLRLQAQGHEQFNMMILVGEQFTKKYSC